MKKTVADLRSRHQDNLWKLEHLWRRLDPKDYQNRRQLTTTAVELAKIDRVISQMEQAKP